MGGDGVAHHVGNALVGTDTALGLIPVGTTNVLARILGILARKTAEALPGGTVTFWALSLALLAAGYLLAQRQFMREEIGRGGAGVGA